MPRCVINYLIKPEVSAEKLGKTQYFPNRRNQNRIMIERVTK